MVIKDFMQIKNMIDYFEKHNLDPFGASFDLNSGTCSPNKKKFVSPPTGACNRVTRPSWGVTLE